MNQESTAVAASITDDEREELEDYREEAAWRHINAIERFITPELEQMMMAGESAGFSVTLRCIGGDVFPAVMHD